VQRADPDTAEEYAMRRLSAALVATAATVALLSACGGGDNGDGQEVASLDTDPPAAEQPPGTEATVGSASPEASTSATGSAPAASAPTDPREAELAYVECMREHGIEMNDPEPGGGIMNQVEEGDQEEFEAADTECQPLLEAALSEVEMDPEQVAELREQLLEYAQCMREHGIDMEDPVVDENGRVEMQEGGPSPGDDEFAAADEECGGAGIGPGATTEPEGV
jgi:pyruvate/2-oxoglutarate dehydrogenase complex dihydrolipoamide acyltransferase (E2) component